MMRLYHVEAAQANRVFQARAGRSSNSFAMWLPSTTPLSSGEGSVNYEHRNR
jgi:hypothetical protein